ncbi:Cyclin B2 [Trichuris trichiura]|uniref:Cyclin B2 n=1 Tax=Trichuris trichiura TaxID=36087 RepID=A0A077Z967_TRITR|nr:Cyclin B2 [Trichuris trichiura]
MDGYDKITPRMRAVLVEWIVQVHFRYKLAPETMFMSDVAKSDLQLVGVTALYLASKYEDVFVMDLNQVIYVTDYTYTREAVLKMEREILNTLGFRICRPLPISFLRRFSRATMASQILHAMAKYFLELMLLDYSMVNIHPSVQAASALRIAMIVLRGEDWVMIFACKTEFIRPPLVGFNLVSRFGALYILCCCRSR